MAEYLERSTVIDIAISAEDVHPYKVAGRSETYSDYNQGWSDACGYISELFEAAPTIDVLAVTSDTLVGSGAIELAPMLRGEWIDDDYGFARCSECGWEWDEPEYKTPYCPNCGAKMEYDEMLTPCKQPSPKEARHIKSLSEHGCAMTTGCCGECRWYHDIVCYNPDTGYLLTAEKFSCSKFEDLEEEKR